MSAQVTLDSKLTVVETITQGFVGSDNTITYDGLNQSAQVFNGGTAVPVSKVASFSKALVAGAATIDLTALPGKTPDETVNFNGLRVQHIKLRNPASNANAITIAKGATNGWTGLGSAFSLTIQPGQTHLMDLEEAGPDVAAGNKTLDLSGTGTQALDVLIDAG